MILIDNFKKYWYLIIPILCLAFYPLFVLFRFELWPKQVDFKVFYRAGNTILYNPSNLYDDPAFIYMPSFALFFIPFSLLNYTLSFYIFFIFNFICAILVLLEFNKILMLKEINIKYHRFIFLLFLSNGWLVYFQFYHNQFKFIVLFIILFVIRREIQFNKNLKEKDLKFYSMNYTFLIIALGMIPHLVFLILIYFFYEIRINDLFKKKNLKKYCIFIVLFMVANFPFVLYPINTLNFFINGITFQSYAPKPYENNLQIFYFREFLVVDQIVNFYFRVISLSILFIITLLLIFNKKLLIEEKFSYFCFVYLFLNTYSSLHVLLIPLAFIYLLYVKFLQPEKDFKFFIKENRIVIIGLISIVGLLFMIRIESIFNFMPTIKNSPWVWFIYLRWVFLLSIMGASIIILHIKNLYKPVLNHLPNENNANSKLIN